MCYSGQCEFEDHMGNCRLKSHRFDEYKKWAKDNGFNFCRFGLDEEEANKREKWMIDNKDKFKFFRETFMW